MTVFLHALLVIGLVLPGSLLMAGVSINIGKRVDHWPFPAAMAISLGPALVFAAAYAALLIIWVPATWLS